MSIKEFNSDLELKGKAIIYTVPNNTGTVLTYNSNTKEVSTRTNAELISDMNLMTTNTEQIVTGDKWFITEGGSDILNHSLRVASYDNSYPGIVFYREGSNSGTLQYDGGTYYFTNSGIQGFGFVKSGGYIKHGSNDDYILTGGGGHETKNNYLKLVDNKSINISSTDLNLLFNTGFFRGTDLINTPENNTGWWYITVEGHDNDSWIKQTATSFGSGNTPNITFQRVCAQGTWTTWEEIITSGVGGSNYYWKVWNSGASKGIDTQTPFFVLSDNGSTAQSVYTGGLLASNLYNDGQFVPTNGIYSKGIIKGEEGFQNRTPKNNERNRIWSFSDFDQYGISYMQGNSHWLGEGINVHFGDSLGYGAFIKNNGRIYSSIDGNSEQWKLGYDFSLVGATQNWVTDNYVSLYTNQTIPSQKVFSGGIDNSYNGAGILINGNGSADTIYPTVSFHQPSLYAGTLSYRGDGFHFMNIVGTNHDSVYARGYNKENSNDNYILLGGGGHRLSSDFAPSSALGNFIPLSQKAQPNGVATLDNNGLVPTTQLPSYVDDVIEAANLAALNSLSVGEKQTGKIYIALDTNKSYRWSGSTFVEISSGAVQSVNGQTGIVNLTKANIGLGNVDNTSDMDKPISTATQGALNQKVNSWENAVAIGFQSSSSLGYPYFVHADSTIIPIASQSWVSGNFQPVGNYQVGGVYLKANTINSGFTTIENQFGFLNGATSNLGGITSWTGNWINIGSEALNDHKSQLLISKGRFLFRSMYGNDDAIFNEVYHNGNFNPTSYQPTGNYVTIDTPQTIIADKTHASTSKVTFLGSETNHVEVYRAVGGVDKIVSGHIYSWYNDSWRVGNKRGGSGNSVGYAFDFSNDGGVTYEQQVLVEPNSNIWTKSFGNANEWNQAWNFINTHGSNLVASSHSHSNKSILDSISAQHLVNWDAAYSWGNHASQGYLTNASLNGYATETWVNNNFAGAVGNATAIGFIGGLEDAPYMYHNTAGNVRLARYDWTNNNFWKILTLPGLVGVNAATPFAVLNNGAEQTILSGGIYTGGGYAVGQTVIPPHGIYSSGLIQTGYNGNSENWKAGYDFSLVGATQTYVNDNFLSTKYLSLSSIAPDDADVKGVMANYTSSFVSGSTDGSLLTLSYSDIWSTQIYGDWRTNEWYVRTQNNGAWNTPQKLFHTGNFNPSLYSLSTHNHAGIYEPVFSKNTAFNKNFGTSAGTVAEGNDARINNGQTAFSYGNHASVGYALISQIPTNNNQLSNGAGYITNASLLPFAALAGTQTFTKTNTFLESPVIPNGTLGTHAVNLNQLNSATTGTFVNLTTTQDVYGNKRFYNVLSAFAGIQGSNSSPDTIFTTDGGEAGLNHEIKNDSGEIRLVPYVKEHFDGEYVVDQSMIMYITISGNDQTVYFPEIRFGQRIEVSNISDNGGCTAVFSTQSGDKYIGINPKSKLTITVQGDPTDFKLIGTVQDVQTY